MREHKVCKSEWTPTLSKGFSGAADPNPPAFMGKEHLVLQLSTGLWRNTSSKARKHPYTTQAVPHCLQSPWRAQVGKEELQLVWYQGQRHTRHRPQNVSQGPCPQLVWSNQVRGVWNGSNHANRSCSWRHIVFWMDHDTETVWVTWLRLGHEAKWGGNSTANLRTAKMPVGFNMGKVQAKGHVLERIYRRRVYGDPPPLNGESSDSALSLSFLPDISLQHIRPHRFGLHSH